MKNTRYVVVTLITLLLFDWYSVSSIVVNKVRMLSRFVAFIE